MRRFGIELASLLLLAGLAHAQLRMGGMGTSRRSGSMGDMRSPGTVNSMSLAEMLAQSLSLDQNQKSEMRTIMDTAQEVARPLQEQLRLGKQSLLAAARSGKTDIDLEPLYQRQAALYGQITVVETKTLTRIYEILKPEQQAKADALFPHMSIFPDTRQPINR